MQNTPLNCYKIFNKATNSPLYRLSLYKVLTLYDYKQKNISACKQIYLTNEQFLW